VIEYEHNVSHSEWVTRLNSRHWLVAADLYKLCRWYSQYIFGGRKNSLWGRAMLWNLNANCRDLRLNIRDLRLDCGDLQLNINHIRDLTHVPDSHNNHCTAVLGRLFIHGSDHPKPLFVKTSK